ncbi:Asp/Glu/hydantoin racemase [Amycolatopsis cynarae]|uniref:Asp/Glu/hydantoin racemase n=2 Tax=Amycolatopsis TaxID=1813 RepID=A0A558D8J6_9PSEU|nr:MULTISPECIES: Asp/Glu/hydantoin racemase [Amycolatopsis]TVT57311.1 Asp/Glu/hydantoin racemase [Amycolatopsis rhizosphaerae]WAL66840.1 Asp/Glu/hydantoin racemase [Amycolatopsis sp. HUAS 11-8]
MDLDLSAFDGPLAQRGIGVIAPFDMALDREVWRWVPAEVSLHLARTPYEPVPVSMEMACLVSNSAHLAAATRDVLHIEPEVVAYLCTSGSFVKGVDYERSLRKTICDAGAPEAVTTSGALAEVLQQLDVHRVSVITPYDADLTGRLRDFLAELDVETLSSEFLGLGNGIWKVSYRTIAERIISADHPDAEAIFVSCTNLATYDLIEPLERALGKPVLTANQLTMWACLRRMALPVVGPGRWLREVS